MPQRPLLLAVVSLLGLTACKNPGTPAGYVGYLTRGAIVGKASYVGLQTGPTSYGLSWLVSVMNVSVTPFSYAGGLRRRRTPCSPRTS